MLTETKVRVCPHSGHHCLCETKSCANPPRNWGAWHKSIGFGNSILRGEVPQLEKEPKNG